MTRLRPGLLGIGLLVAMLAAPPARALSWAYQGEIEDVAGERAG